MQPVLLPFKHPSEHEMMPITKTDMNVLIPTDIIINRFEKFK